MENAANKEPHPAYRELVRQAAQGEAIHNDDTPAKILEVMKKTTAQSLRKGTGLGHLRHRHLAAQMPDAVLEPLRKAGRSGQPCQDLAFHGVAVGAVELAILELEIDAQIAYGETAAVPKSRGYAWRIA